MSGGADISPTDCGAALPATHAAGIEVHEIRFGVIPDAATLHGNRGIPELFEIDALKTHVNGFTDRVLAVLRNAAAFAAQHLVGLWGTVS